MGKKRIGDWFLLSKEKSGSFIEFARGNRPSYDNNYCQKLQRFLDGHKKERGGQRRTAIDVGASYGFVSKHLSEQFDEVKSFEVVDDIRYCLELNVENNDMNNVEVFPCGLSDYNGDMTIYVSERWTGHASKYMNRDIHRRRDARKCDVRTLDSFDFQNVDLIKIDTEGSELNVVRGGLKTISLWRPAIVTEVSIKNPQAVKDAYQLIMLMDSLNYKYHRTIGGDFIFIPDD